MIPLGICSLLVLTVVIERLWAYAQLKKMSVDLMKRVQEMVAANKWSEAVRLLKVHNSPLCAHCQASLDPRPTWPRKSPMPSLLPAKMKSRYATRPLPI